MILFHFTFMWHTMQMSSEISHQKLISCVFDTMSPPTFLKQCTKKHIHLPCSIHGILELVYIGFSMLQSTEASAHRCVIILTRELVNTLQDQFAMKSLFLWGD